ASASTFMQQAMAFAIATGHRTSMKRRAQRLPRARWPFSASILAELQEHWRFLEDALHAYSRSPLSIRKAMLVVALADAMVDRLFAAADNPGDLLKFRAAVSAENAALSLVTELAAHRPRGAQ